MNLLRKILKWKILCQISKGLEIHTTINDKTETKNFTDDTENQHLKFWSYGDMSKDLTSLILGTVLEDVHKSIKFYSSKCRPIM